LDRVNVRQLQPEQVAPAPDLVTADLSFISLTLVLPALVRCASPEADFVLLVKPQFEVGRGRVGAGGVVREPGLRGQAVGSVAAGGGPRPGAGGGGAARAPAAGPGRNGRVLPRAAPGRPAARRGRAAAGRRGRTPVNTKRTMLVVAHVGRPAALRSARLVVDR